MGGGGKWKIKSKKTDDEEEDLQSQGELINKLLSVFKKERNNFSSEIRILLIPQSLNLQELLIENALFETLGQKKEEEENLDEKRRRESGCIIHTSSSTLPVKSSSSFCRRLASILQRCGLGRRGRSKSVRRNLEKGSSSIGKKSDYCVWGFALSFRFVKKMVCQSEWPPLL